MDAVDALIEIAALLERERASRYRAKAFRQAASVLAALPEQTRWDADALRAQRGIGASTFEVIQQAQRGGVPDYLIQLRASVSPERESELRGRLRGDLHSHTEWSDGTTPIESMVSAAAALGHRYLAITDHSPRLRVARGLSAERLREQIPLVRERSTPDLTLLAGIEVDILDDGSLDQDPLLLAELDIVVASAHSKLRMPADAMTRRLVAAVRDPTVNVLGHCTGRLVQGERGTRPPSSFDARAVFAACAENGVAVEINSRPERQDPPEELIGVAMAEGCLFAIDSDAHAPGQLSLLDHGAQRAEAAGVPAERIVTTWGVERLRAWARG
ncbi:PHP domain-containing protein [Microbacterium esteraromaticum]|uniref:PHP domain-containing protein n=1 Tax=Microbacterium esteraromaticum TaxID=57043 RepID=UPI001A8D8418|nr:PHP domain-containing protein [Microbacterium esteraromaticum]MBN8423015.1 PHP domain-containing protein [Microbacterium esteraromaticum]